MVAAMPLFYVVILSDGQGWAVDAEWPDGTIDQICTFKHHFEATDWVFSQSEKWLQERNLTD
jgi:hypothetical protein